MWPTVGMVGTIITSNGSGGGGPEPEPIDITSAVYTSKSFSIASEETNGTCLRFKPDGTKFYVIGTVSRFIYRYSCGTAWDISTASYDSNSYSLNAVAGVIESIFFNPDGTQYYVLSSSGDRVYQFSCGAWSPSTSSYTGKNKLVSAQEIDGHGLAFNDDGTIMYVIGQDTGAGNVYQYSLSVAWDVSTATYASKTFSVNSQAVSPTDLALTSDGKQMLVTDQTGIIFQYELSTAWDISTASYSSKQFSVLSRDNSPEGLVIRPNNLAFYFVGSQFDKVYQYSLG